MQTVIQAAASRRSSLEVLFEPVNPQWILPGDVVPAAEVYVLLDGDFSIASNLEGTVFLNDVLQPLSNEARSSVIRFNGWPGCIEGPIWEVAGDVSPKHQQWMSVIGKQWRIVPDVPGLITPRVISTIINEAYFALGDGISTPDEIDTAMQLGTNYPQGPFAWATSIGIQQVYRLLLQLSETHPRYNPAPALAFTAQP